MAAFVMRKVFESDPQKQPQGVEHLSHRELEVFQLLGRGLNTRQIAEKLVLSFKTVETHREHIKHKLGLRGASELVRRAFEWAQQSPPRPSVRA